MELGLEAMLGPESAGRAWALILLVGLIALAKQAVWVLQSGRKKDEADDCGSRSSVKRRTTEFPRGVRDMVDGGPRPKNVGILAADVYFPSTYVRQAQLERAHGVNQGKFTSGLGQSGMAFVGDREDINSIALTVVASLLEKYQIPRESIGRLEVGTETLVDRAKSTKTVLMSLFEESGNTDIEGTTVVNACYGGTAALLNALAWVESSGWDGRYAIVVAADIAIYADGPAKPTGGCGAVALLVGPDAPLVVDLPLRATHASNTWDFFKPRMLSEYPEVDGKMSKECYLRALDDCYLRFAAKQEEFSGRPFTANQMDYFCFHHPYTKLVQRAFSRLFFLDARRGKLLGTPEGRQWDIVKPWLDTHLNDTYDDRELDSVVRGLANDRYHRQVAPSSLLSMQIGNTYTASVYLNLVCLISQRASSLEGKRILVYSYGSGALATMFQITARKPSSARWSLDRIAQVVDLADRIQDRETVTPEELSEAIRIREKNVSRGGYTPQYSVSSLAGGTYYLEEVRADFTRVYQRKSLNAPRIKGLFYPVHNGATKVLSVEKVARSWHIRESDLDSSIGSSYKGGALDESSTSVSKHLEVTTPMTPEQTLKGMMRASLSAASQDMVMGRNGAAIVVTGISAGLPGKDREVFSSTNLNDLVNGTNFIGPLSDDVKRSLIEKNVVQVKKNPDGTMTKMPADSEEKVIKLAAQLGSFDLTKYGVPAALAGTMDTVVQVAVAAGLEALKDAGIVKGDCGDLSSWKLPEHMRDNTGVVYATSFPALEAAVSEVMRFLQTKQRSMGQSQGVLSSLRSRLETAYGGWANISADDKAAFEQLEKSVMSGALDTSPRQEPFEFDRKFLFRILVLGNAQLAQLVGARGPNMQTNAACAGTTQAIAIAQDMIQQGRCERVVVIASDNASGDVLIPWLGSGFRALGAASLGATVEEAAIPFDKRRKGLILGAGAIGIVLETEAAVARRYAEKYGITVSPFNCVMEPATSQAVLIGQQHIQEFTQALKVRLIDTHYSNSAYHGAALDPTHIAAELEKFLNSIRRKYGIRREDIAHHGVYLSHETSTHASDASSCAANEVVALRQCFGDDDVVGMGSLTLLNTKGYTGHPMGVSFEDIAAVEILRNGVSPPIANLSEKSVVDPYLGKVKLGRGGRTDAKYALRFAAGFGSQVAFALYGIYDGSWAPEHADMNGQHDALSPDGREAVAPFYEGVGLRGGGRVARRVSDEQKEA